MEVSPRCYPSPLLTAALTRSLLLIALGGAIGSVLRYLVALWMHRLTGAGFPWGTLAVNVTGCLLIAVLHALFTGPPPAVTPVREELRLALLVGLLGGFTTFSTFGLETLTLLQDARYAAASAYVLLSNTLGLAAAAAGFLLTRSALSAPAP